MNSIEFSAGLVSIYGQFQIFRMWVYDPLPAGTGFSKLADGRIIMGSHPEAECVNFYMKNSHLLSQIQKIFDM